MIHSMTGFGAAEREINGELYKAELRAVNSKSLDVTLKLPTLLKPQEFFIRKKLHKLHRGKIEFSIISESQVSSANQINLPVLDAYIRQIKETSERHQVSVDSLLQGVLSLPGIVNEQSEEVLNLDEQMMDEWLDATMRAFNEHRLVEGRQLQNDLEERLKALRNHLDSIQPFEEERIHRIKERITKELGSVAAELQADASRLEMELIYYLEKLDINEEKVRLAAHCNYFEDIMADTREMEKGKKLGFLAQEMGREVNTIGSKANHSQIQHIVVLMKEEIEKIKEQINNIL